MGENQGLVWIIIGVLVIAAAVIGLGISMKGTLNKTQTKMDEISNAALESV